MAIGDDTEAMIKNYMIEQNRPHNSKNTSENLKMKYGASISQANVDKVLVALSDLDSVPPSERSRPLLKYENGKQNVYYLRQPDDAADSGPEAMKALDDTLDKAKHDAEAATLQVKALEGKLKARTAAATNDQLLEQRQELDTGNHEKRNKLNALRKSCAGISPQEKSKITKAYVEMVAGWRKRKRIAKDMVDALLETSSKKRKAFMDEMGLETDEQAKIDIKSYA